REAARAARLNCGLWRERGMVRTSTRRWTPWDLSSARNSAMERFEWPIVRISGRARERRAPFDFCGAPPLAFRLAFMQSARACADCRAGNESRSAQRNFSTARAACVSWRNRDANATADVSADY